MQNGTKNIKNNIFNGWLAVLGVVVILNPLILLLSVMGVINTLFIQNSLSTIFDYKVFLGIIIIFEIFFSVFLFALSIYTLILFFKRKKLFPKYQIIFFTSHITFALIDFIFVFLYTGNTQLQEQIIRTIITSIIGIAYILKSVKVKETFIN